MYDMLPYAKHFLGLVACRVANVIHSAKSKYDSNSCKLPWVPNIPTFVSYKQLLSFHVDVFPFKFVLSFLIPL